MEKLNLEKLPDGVIVKTKGSGFERKEPDEINTYYIKIGDKLINSSGFLYVYEYDDDGSVNLGTDLEDYDIEKIWELPIFRVDISYVVKNYILNKKVAKKLIYENKEVRTFTKTELKEKMESILGYPIKITED